MGSGNEQAACRHRLIDNRKVSEMADKARQIYVPGVFGYRRVAKELGVSEGSVRRAVDPAFAERHRIASRDRKRALRGTCHRCGQETRYGGKKLSGNLGVSIYCAACNAVISAERAKTMRGHGSTVGRIIALLENHPARYSEIRDTCEISNQRLGGALDRLLKYGLIERPSRGLYQLAAQDPEQLGDLVGFFS